jgi:ABC-2 type transport system ATP-binding protein
MCDQHSVVRIENLVKRYGTMMAVDHLSLEIRSGEVFGLLGPNGSGKTTTINCILQLLNYDHGQIDLFGRPMSPTAYDLKRRVGVVPQEVAVFDELTVCENVDSFCALYISNRKLRRALVDEAIEFVGLQKFEHFFPKKLSGGLLRRLNIACGIAHKPDLIILDEPTVAWIRRAAMPSSMACSSSTMRAQRLFIPRTTWRKSSDFAAAS